MRYAIAALFALHGSIHLLGFLKPWKLAAVPQLTGRTLFALSEPMGRVVGLAWLLCALLLLAAAAMRVGQVGSFWVIGAIGVALSQALVVLAWPDAKAGTILNVLLAFPIVVAGATARFDRAVSAEVHAMFARAPQSSPVLRAADLLSLPPPVRRWLEASGVVGRERARTVRLKQRGTMRIRPDGAWMPTEASQYFTVGEPGFVWRADVTMFGVLPIAARDRYAEGRGRMTILAGGLVPIVDASGPEIDQGSLLRYLGELIWFPSAAASPSVAWEAIDEHSARATMKNAEQTVAAVFEFDERDRFARMTAQRYFGDTGTLETWFVPATEWKTIRGITMATRGSVSWKLAGGDFEYFRWEVLDVEENLAATFAEAPLEASKPPPIAALTSP